MVYEYSACVLYYIPPSVTLNYVCWLHVSVLLALHVKLNYKHFMLGKLEKKYGVHAWYCFDFRATTNTCELIVLKSPVSSAPLLCIAKVWSLYPLYAASKHHTILWRMALMMIWSKAQELVCLEDKSVPLSSSSIPFCFYLIFLCNFCTINLKNKKFIK